MLTTSQRPQLLSEAINLYESFYDHGYGFREVKRFALKRIGAPGAKQKDETLKRLGDFLDALSDDELASKVEDLRSALVSFLGCNSKIVTSFSYDVGEISAIISAFDDELKSGADDFSATFPRLPNGGPLQQDVVYPAARITYDQEEYLFLGSMRRVREKIELSEEDLTSETKARFGNFTDIAAYTFEDVVQVDVVVFDTVTGDCQIRMSDQRGLSSASQAEGVALYSRYLKKIGGVSRLFQDKNFHSCIKPLYDEMIGSDKVTMFHFEADENGVKKEYKPFDRSDLRAEVYHRSGSSAIDYQFRVFGIRKLWDLQAAERSRSIGVQINGSPRLLNEADPKINAISVFGCADRSDYNFVMSKVKPHVT